MPASSTDNPPTDAPPDAWHDDRWNIVSNSPPSRQFSQLPQIK